MKQPVSIPNVPPPYHFILASTSPRRREFMEILGIPFTVVSPDSFTILGGVDETPLPNELPADLVQRLSRLKAQTVAGNFSSLLLANDDINTDHLSIIIAADTVVVVEDKILGKPANPAEATQMLKLLRRQPHYVYSGLTVTCLPQGIFITRMHQSKVWIRPYTNAEIETYVAGGSPLDKAGAYGIQDQPFAPVKRLEGCFASVMGLPLGELAIALEEIGLSLPENHTLCTQHIGTPCCQLSPNQAL